MKLIAWFVAIAVTVFSLTFCTVAKAEVIADVNITTLYHLTGGTLIGAGLNTILYLGTPAERRADSTRKWAAMGMCTIPCVAKELADQNFDVIDLAAGMAGCGLGIWATDAAFISLTHDSVVYTRRW